MSSITRGNDPETRFVLSETEIDAAWLEKVLAQDNGPVRVASVEVDPAIAGFSVKHRLHVVYDDDAGLGLPSTFMLKGGFGRHGAEWDWVYEGEVSAYQTFLPEVAVERPRTYFAGNEPAR